MKKDNIKYLLLVVFFTFILFLSPISGDDWGNYLEGSLGLRHIIGQALGMYFDWEGRFVSRILINFLTYYKFIWNIVNSICIVGIIYFIVKIIKPKCQRMIFLLATLTILMMNIFTFSQVVVWIAGNITYLFVMPLLLYYFYSLFNIKKWSRKKVILFSILNLIMPMFVEHMGVILVLANIFMIAYDYFKNKKINKMLLIYLFCSIIGLSSMLFSPGSMKRSRIENLEFNKLSLIGKMIYNFPNFLYYTYMSYPILIILMVLGSYFLVRENINNRLFILFCYLYLIIIPILICFINIKDVFRVNIFDSSNILSITYFIIYSIIHFILICCYSARKKNIKIVFYYVIGILANLAMLISPTWGYRTSFGTYIFLSISYLLILDDNMYDNKKINNILSFIIILMINFYSILYISIARQNAYNIKFIERQKKKGLTEIEVVRYPGFVNCNINPENDYHLKVFKKYYGLGSDVVIKLIDNKWKYFIFY